MPLWRQPSPICRVMLNALIPNGIDRRGARNWVSNPALRTMTESSLQRPLKYLPMIKYLTTYSPELNLIEILWRNIKYAWLPFSAYQCLNALRDALENILKNFGSKYQITFA